MSRLLSIAAATAAFGMAALAGCSHRAEEQTTSTTSAPASASSSADAAAAPPATADKRTKSNLPPMFGDAGIPQPSREPDWNLDPNDKARDYVIRYIRATQRYGVDKTACVTVMPSTDAGDRKQVVVKDDPKSTCYANGGAQDAARDVFLVDVPGDRLSVDDPKTRASLRRWPDGSDPEGPPGPVQHIDVSKEVKGPIRQALTALQQVVIRLQLYGRGTYPVYTIAGWHDPLTPDGLAKGGHAAAAALCGASHDMPFAVFAGLDRVTLLRVGCSAAGPSTPTPPSLTWDSML